MVRIPGTRGRACRWIVVLAAAALVLEGATLPAAADLLEETTAHPLADQRREFTLLPQISSSGWIALPWLLDQREQNHFAVDAPEDAAPTGPDWGGLARDTALLIGYQAVAIGVIFLLPEDVSNWNGKSHGVDQWKHNVSHPTFDEDSWWLNYLAHPYVGATYYIRARERGFGPWSSFAYSAFASAAYEFGVEAFFEKPSIQDLIVTPIGGALLGAFVFEPFRAWIRAKPEPEWYDHVGLFLTDPIGGLNSVVERMFSIKSDIHVGLKPPLAAQGDRPVRQAGFGFELSLAW
jgi:Domain of unknown function (DUF3943)